MLFTKGKFPLSSITTNKEQNNEQQLKRSQLAFSHKNNVNHIGYECDAFDQHYKASEIAKTQQQSNSWCQLCLHSKLLNYAS